MMNQKITMDQLQGLVRLETVLAALLLIALAAWYFFDGKASAAQEDLAKDMQALDAARDDLSYWSKNFDRLTLLKELEEIKAVPPPGELPTQKEVLTFRSKLLAYTGENQLPLSTLEVTEIQRNLEGETFRGVGYALVLSGSLEPLLGSLGLLDGYETASVQDLDFFQADQGGDIWAMNLNVDMLYRVDEGDG